MEIREISFDQLFADPATAALFAEYADESSIAGMPPPRPNEAQYLAIAQAGFAHVLAAFSGGEMIGFITLLVSPNPHYSVVIGVVESFFVAHSHRATGAGLRLLRAAEARATERGAVGFLVSAPYGGRLADVMQALSSYRETNRVFFKAIA